MTPGNRDDSDARKPAHSAPPGGRPLISAAPRIRPLTGGGAVAGQAQRPQANSRPVGADQAPLSRPQPPARAPYEAQVRLVSGPRTFDGRIEAISQSDVVVQVAAGLADGERINLRFALPVSQKVVSVPAGVAAREPRSGGQEAVTLAFSIVDEALRKELEGYVKLMRR